VGQLGLFTRAELAEMRDRTRSRRYSPEKEAFRREHERRRAFGLVQRHSRKLRELHGDDGIVALTAAMLGRPNQACDPPVVEQADQPAAVLAEPSVAVLSEPTVAEPSKPTVAELSEPTVVEPSEAPVLEPSVARQSGTERSLPSAEEKAQNLVAEQDAESVPGNAHDEKPEDPRPAEAGRTAIRASIRRRVRHFDRGAFRCETGGHPIAKTWSRESICWPGEVHDGRHPP
jgi:hypothetical protein